MPTDRYLDLLKQGFMKRRDNAPKKQPKPIVACSGCLNWHTEGKHTQAGRKLMELFPRAEE